MEEQRAVQMMRELLELYDLCPEKRQNEILGFIKEIIERIQKKRDADYFLFSVTESAYDLIRDLKK